MNNGSILYFKGADNFDSLRGISPNYLFIDEFAFMKQDAWRQVLKPALSVSGKRCYIASTPRTKQSDFYSMFVQGQENNSRYKSFHMTYKENPLANLEEVEDARKNLPEVIFKAEFLAEFINQGGEVFRNVDNVCILDKQEIDLKEKYFAGIDLGRQNDFTVLIIMNSKKEVVFLYRDNQKDWNDIISDLVSILKGWNVRKVYVESNNVGDVVIDMLRKECGSMIDSYWTGKDKPDLIESLIVEFENMNIKLPKKEIYPELYNELISYTYEYNVKTRTIKYGAPQGIHDDCVMSLAICLDCYKENHLLSINVKGIYDRKPFYLKPKKNNFEL
jgi:PBSX family phage terminase large subunit